MLRLGNADRGPLQFRGNRSRRTARIRPLILAALSIAVIGGVSIWWFFGRNQEPSDQEYRDALLIPAPVTLSPGIHMLGQLTPSVVYVIETSDGLILIDSGLESDNSHLMQQLTALGRDPSQIRAVLLTHAHGDHALGARHLRENLGARIYAGKEDSEILRAGGPREAVFSTFPMDHVSIHPTPVDVELVGGEELTFGDTRIKVLATPGHTPGSLCYLVERKKVRALFTGDTISSLIGDLGTYSAYLAPRYRGNARDYLKSLQTLRAMPVPDLVLPGHPTNERQPHSPRLTESDWHRLLDRGLQDMQALVAAYDADGEDFLDGIPKELLPGLFYLGDYDKRAIYSLKTTDHQFLFDAPGDNGFAAFVTDRWKELRVDSSALTAVLLTSADPDAVGGLPSIVEKWGCTVVAAAPAQGVVRRICPNETSIMDPVELESKEWLPVKVIPLGGRGIGPTAYVVRWQQREVVLSGKVPIGLGGPSAAALVQAFQTLQAEPRAYERSLRALRLARPNLWLPAYPSHAQNANLYGDQWDQIMRGNLELLGK